MEIIRGDDSDFELTFTDVDGNPIDLTGGTVFLTVKRSLSDPDEDALLQKEFIDFDDPTGGITVIHLENSETDLPRGDYYFDIQLKDASSKIESTYVGKFIVKRDVTLRTDDFS